MSSTSQSDHPEEREVQLSVIIPCLNLGHVISDQLTALVIQAYEHPWEVIVADNGSSDNTREVVARYQDRLPGLRFIDASAVRGSSYARNCGAQAARGKYLVFIDADDIIAPGFLAVISKALDKHEFVAPRIDALALNQKEGARLGQHPQFHDLMRYYNQPYLYHVSGTGISLRREVFEQIGGFDESMLRLQDSEFCFRAQLAGVAITFVPEATLYGRNRSSLKEIMRQSYNWGKAEVKLVNRYRTTPDLLRTLLLWLRYGARWGKLMVLISTFRSITDFNRWSQEVARQFGICEAALKQRTAPI